MTWGVSCDLQGMSHVLLQPLEGVEQRRSGAVTVHFLLSPGTAHCQHVCIMNIMELRQRFVVTFTSTLCLPT